MYSHDTCGLGNIRRTLLLADTVRDEYPEASVLVVTGSPVIHAFRIPVGVDYVKLPTLDRTDAERYAPRFLGGAASIMSLRRDILERTVVGFDPDLVVVDKRPAGIDGELETALVAMEGMARRPRLVLGLRDILDEPDRTRQSLQRSRAMETIARYYDEVWVYGEESVFDAVREYRFPDAVARRTRYCGYLKRPTVQVTRPSGPPVVLVTAGGGEDGALVLRAYLNDLVALPRAVMLRSVVVCGPDMPAASRTALRAAFGHLADVEFVDFEPDMTRRYAEADVVVSMAGYNTVCELLSFGKKALLVPRIAPVREQLMRARLLASRGYFRTIEPDALTPGALMREVLDLIGSAAPPHGVDLDGLPRIRDRVRTLLEERRR
ncbi:MAG: glycosyltransferase family protein [Vicinamibacterales bacterium]